MPDKRTIAFDVPSTVKTASQTGWVYRSAPVPNQRTRTTVRSSSDGPSWTARVTDWLAMPFSLPLCLILSLVPQSRRTTPSK